MMVVFLNCEDIVITDLTFANSPSWTIRTGYCDDVRIRGVTIRDNLMIPNSDGIHVRLGSRRSTCCLTFEFSCWIISLPEKLKAFIIYTI